MRWSLATSCTTSAPKSSRLWFAFAPLGSKRLGMPGPFEAQPGSSTAVIPQIALVRTASGPLSATLLGPSAAHPSATSESASASFPPGSKCTTHSSRRPRSWRAAVPDRTRGRRSSVDGRAGESLVLPSAYRPGGARAASRGQRAQLGRRGGLGAPSNAPQGSGLPSRVGGIRRWG